MRGSLYGSFVEEGLKWEGVKASSLISRGLRPVLLPAPESVLRCVHSWGDGVTLEREKIIKILSICVLRVLSMCIYHTKT